MLLAVFKAFGGVRQGALHFRQGFAWLFPWLAGLALISYLGNFPEKSAGAGNLGVLELRVVRADPGRPVGAGLRHRQQGVPRPELVEEHIEQSGKEAAVEVEELGMAP